ncbi:hypothetical protein Snov_0038 [Ancylobacter novellus DSM 506]|uniref:Uncharacterized protein n=1 Tax=Ancylobacter novellus (strain ATCC 8093 / DSM 506 / JCM 20403 / CCM 1077 / IAM 12100 / NBRC 12443 / NCIMB 10456) TaxID=639283 RepID=D6ZZW1_ANCN5|nr:hypothetical protein [Ancylobacter novellus]ADH87375.1 hypothetical protein Snov_0038 [Ancylobacter novellus DSM 506]
MCSSNERPRRAAFHEPTGRLLINFDHQSGIGTLEEWETYVRFIQREVTRQRERQYQAAHPWHWRPEPEF